MEIPNVKTFEGIVQSVYIKTEIGSFRPQYFDRETGQCLLINKNELVKVDRISDAEVLSKSCRKQIWVDGIETVKLNQEEKDQLFEIIGSLFNKDSSIENWLDGPFLEVILTKTDGSKYSYSGWSNIMNDHNFFSTP